jgi:hypothetical protein
MDHSNITPPTQTLTDQETGVVFAVSKSQANPAPGNPNCTRFSVQVSWVEQGPQARGDALTAGAGNRIRRVTLSSLWTN